MTTDPIISHKGFSLIWRLVVWFALLKSEKQHHVHARPLKGLECTNCIVLCPEFSFTSL